MFSRTMLGINKQPDIVLKQFIQARYLNFFSLLYFFSQ